jgi:ABC-type branched-subunit amino acid transport system ATPase component
LALNLLNDIFQKIVEINKETGAAVLIVEQKVKEVLAISRRVYLLSWVKTRLKGNQKNCLTIKSY